MATINENGDVLVTSGPLTFKVRSEEIVIRNQDPSNKRVDIYESARLITGDGSMGTPMTNSLHTVPVDPALMSVVISVDGVDITGIQVFKWLAAWAAQINSDDADDMVKKITG